MKRLVVGTLGLYLLFALIGRFVEGHGRCDVWLRR